MRKNEFGQAKTSPEENGAGPALRVVARIRTGFPEKFGIPRQSGLVPSLRADIVFEPGYRVPEAVRGLAGFSHIWLLWGFSRTACKDWSPTVRPPRLGGNERVGVFATRSPFRPNPLGLSCVKLERVDENTPRGPVLHVLGADLADGTPIYDIKPYLPYADSRPGASDGFVGRRREYALEVDIPPELLRRVPADDRSALLGVLAQDPRPSYQSDPERVYGLSFGGFNIRFLVRNRVLFVRGIEDASDG